MGDTVTLRTDSDIAAIAALKAHFDIDGRDRRRDGGVHGARTGRASSPACSRSSGFRSAASAVARPTLDDVFLAFTGSSIRDAESEGSQIARGQLAQSVTATAMRRHG